MNFQAAPERDVDLRSKALWLSQGLRDAVRGLFSREKNLRQLAQYEAVRFDTTLLPGAVPGLEAHVDIVVILKTVDVANPRLIGAATPVPPTLALFMLPPFDYARLVAAVFDPRSPQHRQAQFAFVEIQHLVDNWFETNISAVVHELTHLFDFIRSNTRSLTVPRGRSRAAYVSDPWEYNAHFQHMLVELGRELQKAPGWVQHLAVDSFEAFVEFAAETDAGQGFLPHLTPKYRKKALARLWQTWDHMREQSLKVQAERDQREAEDEV
jgi:hypothetical protein